MDREEFIKLIDKQVKGESTPEEDDLIFNFYDKAQSKSKTPFVNPQVELEIKNNLRSSINKSLSVKGKGNTSKTRSLFGVILRYAAVLLLISVVSFLFFQKNVVSPQISFQTKTTNQEQKVAFTLSDGTRVYLNTLSELKFPEAFDGPNRTVEVKGEAFFEVAKDSNRPFIVKSNGLTTQVLGTSFNINSHNPNDVVVAVKTGSVQVSSNDEQNNKVTLSPNQKAVFNKEEKAFTVEEVNMDYYLDWRNKTIEFQLDDLDMVFKRLAKVYNLEIELIGYEGTCAVKASFPNNNLYSVLYGLENLVDFEYVWKGEKKLQVYYKGCKN